MGSEVEARFQVCLSEWVALRRAVLHPIAPSYSFLVGESVKVEELQMVERIHGAGSLQGKNLSRIGNDYHRPKEVC